MKNENDSGEALGQGLLAFGKRYQEEKAPPPFLWIHCLHVMVGSLQPSCYCEGLEPDDGIL